MLHEDFLPAGVLTLQRPRSQGARTGGAQILRAAHTIGTNQEHAILIGHAPLNPHCAFEHSTTRAQLGLYPQWVSRGHLRFLTASPHSKRRVRRVRSARVMQSHSPTY